MLVLRVVLAALLGAPARVVPVPAPAVAVVCVCSARGSRPSCAPLGLGGVGYDAIPCSMLLWPVWVSQAGARQEAGGGYAGQPKNDMTSGDAKAREI